MLAVTPVLAGMGFAISMFISKNTVRPCAVRVFSQLHSCAGLGYFDRGPHKR